MPGLTRRAVVLAGVAAPVIAHAQPRVAETRLADLERRSGGRLGVAVLDTGTGRRLEHRSHERFAMCSTHKALSAAALLARVDAGRERLDRRVVFGKSDLVAYSPTTETRVGGAGMTLAELAQAAVTLSDNTAANLLLKAIGGPAGWTAYARALGDTVSRLDRWEPALNSAIAGDARDTTTPAAMAGDLRKLLVGQALSAASRAQLAAWMAACKTGEGKLRAGLPPGWRIGDKTGSGAHGASNDIAILWPAARPPILACVYTVGSSGSTDARNAVIADVGRIVAGWA